MAIGGVLFDIDGVLVTSWQPIDGAAQTLRILAEQQIARSYLTNTTTRTRAQIADLLTAAGMDVAADEVITAAALTAEYVRDRYPGARCFLVNSGHIGEDMPGVDVVYSSEFTGPVAPETPTWCCSAGPDQVQPPHAQLGLRLDGPRGAGGGHAPQHRLEHHRRIAGRYRHVPGGMEQTSGRKATAVGKPAPEGFLAAANRLGVDPDEMYMVGDDLNNDVLAAQVVGMAGVLVRTGKFRQATLDRWATDEFAMQPNHVIDSVADLPALLGL